MGESDFEEEEGWKDSKKKSKPTQKTGVASSFRERDCAKAKRVPGILVLDERVVKLLHDVERRSCEVPAFANGLEDWQWSIFVEWHLGNDADLANRYSLSEHRLATKQADGKWQFHSLARGMSYYIDKAVCKCSMPKSVVDLVATGDRRGAREALRKAMKK